MALLDVGDVWSGEQFVYTDAGVLATATAAVTVTLPDGTTDTADVTEVTTGQFVATYTPTLSGTHYVRWVFTSVAGVSGDDTAVEDAFSVSEATNTYLSFADAKDYLNLSSTADDAELEVYVEVACELAQQVADTQFARKTVVDTLSVTGDVVSLVLSKRPVLSVTSVTENGTTLTANTGYTTDLRWGRIYRQSGQYTDACWYQGRRNVVVTYKAGYEVIPTAAMFATKAILGHLWENQRGSALSGYRPTSDDYPVPGTNWFIPNKARDILLDFAPPKVA